MPCFSKNISSTINKYSIISNLEGTEDFIPPFARYLVSPGVLDARYGCTPYTVQVG